MKHSALILLILVLFTSCNDRTVNPEISEREFVPGYVIIGIDSNVSIERVFELINEQHLHIDKMKGFFNFSNLPIDSLNYVIDYLKDKPYLNRPGFTGGSASISESGNRIIVTEFLFEMDISAQSDWLNTIEILELEDLGNNNQNLTVLVEEGTENFWATKFATYPEVKWTDLNWIANIERS